MAQPLMFSLLLAAVVLVGFAWLIRGALKPSMDEVDPDEPVVVAGPGAHMEIEVMRAKLDAFGVQSYVRSRVGPIMPGGVPPQFGGWEVLVRRGDADEARAILADEPSGDD